MSEILVSPLRRRPGENEGVEGTQDLSTREEDVQKPKGRACRNFTGSGLSGWRCPNPSGNWKTHLRIEVDEGCAEEGDRVLIFVDLIPISSKPLAQGGMGMYVYSHLNSWGR